MLMMYSSVWNQAARWNTRNSTTKRFLACKSRDWPSPRYLRCCPVLHAANWPSVSTIFTYGHHSKPYKTVSCSHTVDRLHGWRSHSTIFLVRIRMSLDDLASSIDWRQNRIGQTSKRYHFHAPEKRICSFVQPINKAFRVELQESRCQCMVVCMPV